jgi:hypothetical protein
MATDIDAAIRQAKSCFDKYRRFTTTGGRFNEASALAILQYELTELVGACTFQDGDVATSRLIFWAKAGNEYADNVLRNTAMVYADRGQPLSKVLTGYICFAKPSTGLGLGKRKTLYRDALLAAMTHRITQLGFLPTRNSATNDKESACSIVAKASGVHEDVVVKAWKRLGRWPEIAAASL